MSTQSRLLVAVATVGPVAINIDASTWHTYESGVFNGCAQDNVDINHVVQLVGYGTCPETKQDYWLVRNSWTSQWGVDGYIKLARGSGYCGTDFHNGDGVGCDYDVSIADYTRVYIFSIIIFILMCIYT